MRRQRWLAGLLKGWNAWLLGLGAIAVTAGLFMTITILPMAWTVGRPSIMLPGLVFMGFGLLLILAIVRDICRQ